MKTFIRNLNAFLGRRTQPKGNALSVATIATLASKWSAL